AFRQLSYYPLSLHDALPICGDKYLRTVFLSRYPRCSIISCIFFASAQNLSIRSSIPGSLSRGFSLLSGGISVLSGGISAPTGGRSEEHTSELQSRFELVCRL